MEEYAHWEQTNLVIFNLYVIHNSLLLVDASEWEACGCEAFENVYSQTGKKLSTKDNVIDSKKNQSVSFAVEI